MKKLSCALAASFAMSAANAQMFGFGIGYNVNFISPDSLDAVINLYNDTRSWLDVEMEPIDMTKGVSFNMQGKTNGIFYSMGYDWQRQKSYAQGTEPLTGTLQRRDLRLKMDVLQISIGAGVNTKFVSINGGLATEIGQVKAQTRKAPPDDIGKEKWENLVKDFNLYVSPFAYLLFGSTESFIRLSLQPYYRFALWTNDFALVNETLNGVIDPAMEASLSGFGVKAMIVLLLSNN